MYGFGRAIQAERARQGVIAKPQKLGWTLKFLYEEDGHGKLALTCYPLFIVDILIEFDMTMQN